MVVQAGAFVLYTNGIRSSRHPERESISCCTSSASAELTTSEQAHFLFSSRSSSYASKKSCPTSGSWIMRPPITLAHVHLPQGMTISTMTPMTRKWYGDLYAVAPSRTLWDGHEQTNVFDIDDPQYHVEIRTSITASHGVWYPCAIIIEDVDIIDRVDTASAKNIVSATALVEEGWCLYSQLREGQRWVVGSDVDGIRRLEVMEIDGEYRIITAWEIRNDTENLIELDQFGMDNESDRTHGLPRTTGCGRRLRRRWSGRKPSTKSWIWRTSRCRCS